jgi:hypothetical protein
MADSDKKERDKTKDLGMMFLCLVAGYGLSQYQQSRRSQGQLCYQQVSDTSSLPGILADKAEEIIRQGGQAGIRRVGDLLELIVQGATGDTQIFREAVAAAKGAYTPSGTQQGTQEARRVERYDEATGTWRPV